MVKHRHGCVFPLSWHSQRPVTVAHPWPCWDQGQATTGWRSPTHLGFHELLFYAFGRILTVLQLLQLTFSSLLCLADILQQLSGLCAGFYSLAGKKGQGMDGQFIQSSKWKRSGNTEHTQYIHFSKHINIHFMLCFIYSKVYL